MISASDFGSASIRRTCCSSTAGSLSLPCAARSISSSSGMLLHRKNDSREASAEIADAIALAGGQRRQAPLRRDRRIPDPRACAAAPLRCRRRSCRRRSGRPDRTPSATSRSAGSAGRRNACFASVEMIVSRAGCLPRARWTGWQTKILRRLGVSAAPVGVVRPFDPHLADVRIEQEARDRARRVHRPLERLVQLAARHVVGREERHADRVQARLDRNAQASRGRCRSCSQSPRPSRTASRARRRPCTSSCSPLMPPEDRLEVAGDALHLEGVLAVGRELDT